MLQALRRMRSQEGLRRKFSSLLAPAIEEYPLFRAEPRPEELLGTKSSRKMRMSGRIPSVLYGVSADGDRERRLLSISTQELSKELRTHKITIENTLFRLQIAGDPEDETTLVLPRQIHVRAGHGNVVSCNFLRYAPGTIVDIPIRFTHSEQNLYLKRTGYLVRVESFLKCKLDSFHIPSFVDLSIAEGGKNHVFKFDDIAIPPGLTVIKSKGPGVVAVIQGGS